MGTDTAPSARKNSPLSITWLVDTWGGILTLPTGVYSVYGKGWLKMYADELSLSTSHVSSILLSLRDNMDVTTIYFLLLLWYFHAGSFYFLKTLLSLGLYKWHLRTYSIWKPEVTHQNTVSMYYENQEMSFVSAREKNFLAWAVPFRPASMWIFLFSHFIGAKKKYRNLFISAFYLPL